MNRQRATSLCASWARGKQRGFSPGAAARHSGYLGFRQKLNIFSKNMRRQGIFCNSLYVCAIFVGKILMSAHLFALSQKVSWTQR